MKWTTKRINLLEILFPIATKTELLNAFPTTYGAIDRKAHYLGFIREKYKRPQSKLKKLLEETPETYYWIGFLMADGHFSQKNQISLGLAVKDEKHLRKFADFINKEKIHAVFNVRHPFFRLSAMDNEIVPRIKEKFDIHHKKTYHPPDIQVFEKMPDNLFLSFFIGYVCGDGNLKRQTGRKDWILQLCCHKSWRRVYKYFLIRLNKIFNTNCRATICSYKESSKAKKTRMKRAINGGGGENVIRMAIGKNFIIRGLKRKILEFNLPVLQRKWGDIDENHILFYEKNDENKKKITEMLRQKKTRKEMCFILNMNQKRLDGIMRFGGLSYKKLGIPQNLGKKINQISKLNGEVIKIWNTVSEASGFFNRTPGAISNVLTGRSQQCAGFKWSYAD